ncbi:uncharacterized protein MONBRDRAFT_27368 [Monosiga brevicollis MX1]|uniref:Nicotinamide-nucleotide adenylyltransferase n=1 Tax=Monosiga brevicollis TaxID=81824 RepID=A9V531_MONBE|nr:uncharacterized protein MONBRDRAFT_27368 [Monosiga brevicollis MX1]EDQ87204.1 predicted protein [Monosiga brevicollis MX1]|eukprot:XP_001747817.1 hypothetical protein [Monosiga brevicollis MX1]
MAGRGLWQGLKLVGCAVWLRRGVPRDKEPVVLIACGSFSPVTLMHLRLLEDARDTLHAQGHRHVIGGYLSPTHDKYGKKTLALGHHRLNMTALAVEDSEWLNVDVWENAQSGWTPTALVLDRFERALQAVALTDEHGDPHPKPIKVMLTCGADLLDSFETIKEDGSPLWQPAHQDIIARNGIVCLERQGTDIDEVIARQDVLARNRANIVVFPPAVTNSISSTTVRRQLAQGRSVRYLIPRPVEDYIYRHQLHRLPNWQA